MKPFDLNTAPLAGITLIEAGAGTGKTFTLAGIFLRLIIERGLRIEQILVVTYTKAATEELKTRIRGRLTAARAAFRGAAAQDEFLAHLAALSPVDPHLALQRITDALTDFDRASIFTIHGFCQRLLQHFAFETGNMFQSELVQEQQAMIQEVADDFWRRHISNAPYELAHYALQVLKGPERLAALLGYSRYPGVIVLPDAIKPSLDAIAPWRKAAAELGRLWAAQRQRVLNLMADPGLNARFYGKCEPDPRQPNMSQRRIRLMQLAATVDRWNGKYPLFNQVERFCSSFLERATKMNHGTPRHPFFETCDAAVAAQERMVVQLSAYVRYLKVRLHGLAREKLEEKKSPQNILFFDDLLLQVHAALGDKRGQALAEAVNDQYSAALVDEFQDTDPLQYEIFQRLFGRPSDLLVMIGDPKQAIYSFRGADIFSYLKAAESARTHTTLTRNWRSTPILIQAVNTLFGSHERPFGFDRIRFNPAVPAQPDPSLGRWPLTFWHLTPGGNAQTAKPLSQETAVRLISEAVAQEIVALVSDPQYPLAPAQIAVLTRTHRQSQSIKKFLMRRNVPAVLYSAGSVFDTPEAEALARIMSATAAPGDPKAVRAALATDLLGVQAQEFYAGSQDPPAPWQMRWTAFVHDHRVWLQRGFYCMLRGLMTREKVKARLLAQPEGERRLTNLLHLAELLHHAEAQQHLRPEGLIKWLESQRQSLQKGSDEQQLRLDSDALAVRIITMHKSKGLQFDVVFCPFVWSGVGEEQAVAAFHDQHNRMRPTLAVGPGIAPDHLLQARKEALSENLRMLYVALTRARQRCYTVWGRISNTEVSAPAYLLHAPKSALGTNDWIAPLAEKMRSITDKQIARDLQALVQRSQGSIIVEPPPTITGTRYRSGKAASRLSKSRTLTRTATRNWRIASFSSLIARLSAAGEGPDRDQVPPSPPAETTSAGPAFASLFAFPKGVGAGLFFHDVLEHWDPACADRRQSRMLVSDKLKAHGFDPGWAPAVTKMLADLAATPLQRSGDGLILAQVPMTQRISEMEFYFPLKAFSVKDLQRLFERHGHPLHGQEAGRQLGRLTFAPLQGYLKGYIDAVFHLGGRYYLVDWKSNHLGDSLADYQADALARTMVADYYFLQYSLYLTALDQLLKQKIQDYDYARHFGGVFYVFLRGIGPDRTGDTGVFFERPDAGLISDLGELLIKRK
jgi:exodeoxyribonuclease V beta subunit